MTKTKVLVSLVANSDWRDSLISDHPPLRKPACELFLVGAATTDAANCAGTNG